MGSNLEMFTGKGGWYIITGITFLIFFFQNIDILGKEN